jgi:molecular chaperone GrpE
MSKDNSTDPKQDKWKAFSERQEAEAAAEPVAEEQETVEGEQPSGLTYETREDFEQQLNKMDKELSDLKEAAIRAKAEAENVRRRAERDVQNAHKYGVEKLLNDLLPVVDSLVRGLEGDEPTDAHAKALREGMVLTLGLLEKTLEKHGVSVINPERGEAFNPAAHEAMAMQPAEGLESNTVIQVLQKGYMLNGRVLRAAMVMVAA